ncbi:MAG TPA: response regulator, partial [Rhodanobacter sp.]
MNVMLPKILVVDDTHANLVAMRRLLAQSGAQLFEARSGNEALALCLDHQFALILLDINMPDMDGFE